MRLVLVLDHDGGPAGRGGVQDDLLPFVLEPLDHQRLLRFPPGDDHVAGLVRAAGVDDDRVAGRVILLEPPRFCADHAAAVDAVRANARGVGAAPPEVLAGNERHVGPGGFGVRVAGADGAVHGDRHPVGVNFEALESLEVLMNVFDVTVPPVEDVVHGLGTDAVCAGEALDGADGGAAGRELVTLDLLDGAVREAGVLGGFPE